MASNINIGDIVVDINTTWPDFGEKGVVTSVNGINIIWRKDDGELRKDPSYDLDIVIKSNKVNKIIKKTYTF